MTQETKYFNKDGIEFKVGDKVKVLRKGVEHDPDGMGPGKEWKNCWIGSMDVSIGKTLTIKKINSAGVEFKDGPAPTYLGYPLNVLENLSVNPPSIEVGDIVRVLSSEGDAAFKPYINQELVVREVGRDYCGDKIVRCFGEGLLSQFNGQFASRFALVRKAGEPVPAKPFGVDDLKDGMRIETKNGRSAVVYTSNEGEKLIAYVNTKGEWEGFDDAQFEAFSHRAYFSIAKVFGIPEGNYDKMKLQKRGKLVWSNNTVAIAEADAKVVKAQTAQTSATDAYHVSLKTLANANDILAEAKRKAAEARN